MSELGYVPGQTIVVDARTYTTAAELDRVLATFVQRKVDVIFVGQPFVAMAATRATREIPIVCGSCGDPTENGLAVSLASPGGNVTGLASLSAELIGKRLELMKELFPGATRHAVFLFPANPGTGATSRALDAAGRTLGVEIQRVEIRDAGGFETAFRSAARGGAETVLLRDDPMLRGRAAQIAELAQKHRMPVSTGVLESGRRRRPDGIRARPRRPVPARRLIRGPDPQGCPPSGPALSSRRRSSISC